MNVVISGYGRMGKLIYETAVNRKHNIVAIVDKNDDWDTYSNEISKSDIVIDFSLPETVIKNIEKCFDLNIPIVIGTTGWYDKIDEIRNICIAKNKSVFYAPNFSMGVNIFFLLNKYLSSLMNEHPEYDVFVKEVHHTSKIDSPSGTAIKIAEDIIKISSTKEKWINFTSLNKAELKIISERKDNIVGNHKVIYSSNEDEITIEHNAKNRNGFAIGAVLAAEWLKGKKGFFEMKDMLSVRST